MVPCRIVRVTSQKHVPTSLAKSPCSSPCFRTVFHKPVASAHWISFYSVIHNQAALRLGSGQDNIEWTIPAPNNNIKLTILSNTPYHTRDYCANLSFRTSQAALRQHKCAAAGRRLHRNVQDRVYARGRGRVSTGMFWNRSQLLVGWRVIIQDNIIIPGFRPVSKGVPHPYPTVQPCEGAL